jgi:hypothetical protein
MDPDGGSAFVPVGTSQLLSVPFALQARNATHADTASVATGPWVVNKFDQTISYDRPVFTKQVNIGNNNFQETPSALYINFPIPTFEQPKSNGIFLQATDVLSRGFPLWLRSNTSSLNFGYNTGDTQGRMFRMQDQRFEFDAIWDFGIDENKSMFIMGGNNDFTKKLSITTDGKVGINNPLPDYNLDVNGSLNAGSIFMNGLPLSVAPWTSNGTNSISYNGSVGINQSSPNYTLDVNGTVNATNILLNGAPLPGSPWQQNGNDVFYTQGHVNIGATSAESPSGLYVNIPIPSSYETRANGIFVQASDVLSRGFPLWLRSNTSSLTYGTSEGQTQGRMLRMQDQRFGFEAIWDLGIDQNKSFFIIGGNNDFNKKFIITTDGNVGVGTEAPLSKLDVTGGDIYINNINSGVIMKSPNGSCFRMTVSDAGEPVFTPITCPD